MCSQEERWHEASTFPSTSLHKTNVILSLGKQRLQPAPPSPPAGDPTPNHPTLSAVTDIASRLGGSFISGLGGDTNLPSGDSSTPFLKASDGSRSCDSSSNALGAVEGAEGDVNDEIADVVVPASNNTAAARLRGSGSNSSSTAGLALRGGAMVRGSGLGQQERRRGAETTEPGTERIDWGGDEIDAHVTDEDEDENGGRGEYDGRGHAIPGVGVTEVKTTVAASGEGEGDASAGRSGGGGVRDKLTSRLARWNSFGKPKVRRLVMEGEGENGGTPLQKILSVHWGEAGRGKAAPE